MAYQNYKLFDKAVKWKFLAVETIARVQPCPCYVGVRIPCTAQSVSVGGAPSYAKLSAAAALSNAVRRAALNEVPSQMMRHHEECCCFSNARVESATCR